MLCCVLSAVSTCTQSVVEDMQYLSTCVQVCRCAVVEHKHCVRCRDSRRGAVCVCVGVCQCCVRPRLQRLLWLHG